MEKLNFSWLKEVDVSEWLKKQNAGLSFFLLALFTQLSHAQDVALGVSKGKGLDHWSSWGFALSLESAVLYAVMNGQHYFSYVFAAFSIAINIAYYESGMDDGSSMFFKSQFSLHWDKWVLSIILPFAIAFYSHTIAKRQEKDSLQIESANAVQREEDNLQSVQKDDANVQDVANEWFAKIQQALQMGRKSKAQIANETGIPQTTLFRANGGNPKGYLPKMEDLHLIKPVQIDGRTLYELNGASK